MPKNDLNFISRKDLLRHVKETVGKYRFDISLKDFNRNLVDPIKFSFDAAVYGKTVEEMIETEIIRQIDKSNTNHIGYFHQNIFKFIGNGWEVLEKGYDVVNVERKIYVEMKNKHNTMNSSSSQKTYIKMQNTILRDDDATCLLVEVIAKGSHDRKWTVSVDGEQMSHRNIRRVSIDKFYQLLTGDAQAFFKLCQILPSVITEAVSDLEICNIESSVLQELEGRSSDLLESLYLLAFEKYEGFGVRVGSGSPHE
jgi:hypothetical protein